MGNRGLSPSNTEEQFNLLYLLYFLIYILGKFIPRIGDGLHLFKLDTLGNLLIPILLLVFIWRRKREDVTEFFLIVFRNSGPLFILMVALLSGFTSLIVNGINGTLVPTQDISTWMISPDARLIRDYGVLAVVYLSVTAALMETYFFAWLLLKLNSGWKYIFFSSLMFPLMHIHGGVLLLMLAFLMQLIASSLINRNKKYISHLLYFHLFVDIYNFSIINLWV